VVQRLVKAYTQLVPRTGDPLDSKTLIGPMHSSIGVQNYKSTLEEVKSLGGKIVFGGKVLEREGFFVEPAIVTGLAYNSPVVMRETFAPIVYALKTKDLNDAIKINNCVDQGLSSSLFTQNISNIFQVIKNFFYKLFTSFNLIFILCGISVARA
jgi:aldehyde dehydrogenase family 7 member A1